MLNRRGLGLATASLAFAPAARAQPAPEILARYPNGTFLENLAIRPDGSVLFTSYFARAVEAWSPAGGATRFATLDVHPVSLAATGDGGHALAVHGTSFLAGPGAMRGQAAVLLLDAAGAVTRRIPLPEAIFPNGGLLLAPGRLLLADSALGRVWEVDLAAGSARAWLDHPLLAPDPALPYPGVNGIKRQGDTLILSNSATRQLLRLRLAGTAPQGVPETMARMTGGVDDFDIAPDGTIYAATHAEGLARLPPGAATPVMFPAPGLDGSTAVLLAPGQPALYVLGTGGLSAGGRGEAALGRVALPPG
ncbi:SMP-30/gluconolactonase/LRE family protein [Falsiroseomonas ponticola]|uniref:hypothetical protein n=1 Tax=Falsiroseomonas ponticola TaxID=2786951 RepID=UPI0019348FE6|nr:hypothetical protein [Roseomonas ponticola]